MRYVMACLVVLLTVLVTQSSTPCKNSTRGYTHAFNSSLESTSSVLVGNANFDRACYHNKLTGDENNFSQDDILQKDFESMKKTTRKYFSVPAVALGILTSVLTVIILQKGALRSSSTVYIMGLSCSNLLCGLVQLLSYIFLYESIGDSVTGKTAYSYYAAYIFPLSFIAISAGAWTIVVFAIERFLAIFYPMKYYISCESRAKKIVLAIFVAAFLTNITRFFVLGVREVAHSVTNESLHVFYYTEFGLNPVHNSILFWFYAVTVSLVPVPLLFVLTILIIVKLGSVRNKRQRLQEGNQGVSDSESKRTQIERVLVGSLLTFLLCYIPVAGTVITVAINGSHVFFGFIFWIKLLFFFSSIILDLRALLDFFMYVCCSKEIRNSVKNLFYVKNKATQK